jgi:hypothetical protein
MEPAASLGTGEFYEYACLLLLVGDKGRYRGLIQTLGDQADKSENPRVAYELARACIITPDLASDPRRVIRWARLAAEKESLAWHSHVVGAAYYRAGEFEQALRWLGESLKQTWDMGRPLSQFVLAMTHRRMGHDEQAAALLKDTIGLVEAMESRRVDGAVPGVFAADWMSIQLYRREAESLIIGSRGMMVPIPGSESWTASLSAVLPE